MSQPILQNPQLDGDSFHWKGGPVGVLLLHGMTATTTEVRPLARTLHEHGFTVAAPLLPGHGTTPEDLNRQKWRDWVNKAEDGYQYLSGTCEKVFVGGNSMGGLLSLFLASEHADICGIMLFAAAMRIEGIWLSPLLAPFTHAIPKRSTDESMPWKGYYVNPVHAAAQLFYLQREVRRRLKRIHQPALILQGLRDQTINPRSAQIIYDAIGSKKKYLHWLKDSPHVLLLGSEFSQAAELTLNFMKTTLEFGL